ncbi:hypothetical protein MP228_004712 [Amoeboaphelidium protococcarum]|nr:hypothetical protein MP228_004712 [Amoeboaphelidium protococcarum]
MLGNKASYNNSVADFVSRSNGHTVISRVLIANNGIAAVKEIRSVRKWAYETFGYERAIEFVAMATPEDLSHNAEYIRLADQCVDVPGGSNHNNYANVDLIVDIAKRTQCHAVWAGWGHASENPKLPSALKKCGIVFIGPPASAMWSLGDKISSTIVAQSAQVPTMAWSGDGIMLDEDSVDKDGHVTVPDDLYQSACVKTAEEGLEQAKRIGFPVMIKASEGGGGKGIRKVESADKFIHAYEQCCAEVAGSPIFVMKLAGNARHLEVQILADQYGNVISLFGRDCSVQRRHQKIVEEAPVTIAPRSTFEKMELAAVRLAKMVGYVSAGTVEYLYEPETDNFYFLELNPRLQVEHPCTEMVTGINLPASQLLVAMGIPLHDIKEIRLMYGLSPRSSSLIDFDFTNPQSSSIQRRPSAKGHVIAARITAENPEEGFKPSGGLMESLNFRSSLNVWGYFSVGNNGGLHEFADSQFGHVFAYGEDRHQARKNMIMALKELSIRGDFRTTVEYLVKLLETEAFSSNSIHTGWLDMLITKRMTAEKPDKYVAVICGAVVKAQIEFAKKRGEYMEALKRGQVASRSLLKLSTQITLNYERQKFSFSVNQTSPASLSVAINGSRVEVQYRLLSDQSYLVLFNNKSHNVYARDEVDGTRMIIDGKTCILEKDLDPSQLRSPSPGKLIRHLVKDGAHVNKLQAYAEIEVMKMCMPLIASESGVITFVKQPGSVLKPNDLIGRLTFDSDAQVTVITPFTEKLPEFLPPVAQMDRPVVRFDAIYTKLKCHMDGYQSCQRVEVLLSQLCDVLSDNKLAVDAAIAAYSSIQSRLPPSLDSIISPVLTAGGDLGGLYQKIIECTDYHHSSVQDQLSSFMECLKQFSGSVEDKLARCFRDLLRKFYEVEVLFDNVDDLQSKLSENSTTTVGVIMNLREQHSTDLQKVTDIVVAHINVMPRLQLVMALLDKIDSSLDLESIDELKAMVKKLAQLNHGNVAPAALKAREMVIKSHIPSLDDRVQFVSNILAQSTASAELQFPEYKTPNISALVPLINTSYTLFDVLVSFMFDNNRFVSLAAMQVYIRRAFHSTLIQVDDLDTEHLPFYLKWSFSDSSVPSSSLQQGLMFVMDDLSKFQLNFLDGILNKQTNDMKATCLYIVTKCDNENSYGAVIEQSKDVLKSKNVIQCNFIIFDKVGKYPNYQSFKLDTESGAYKEDLMLRNIEPAMAHQLELHRLSNFKIAPVLKYHLPRLHIYQATGKENTSDERFFLRVMARPVKLVGSTENDLREATIDYLTSLGDRVLMEALDALEIVCVEQPKADCNHIFINFVPHFKNITARDVELALPGFIMRHGYRLWKLRVTNAEIRIVIYDHELGKLVPHRFFLTNVSGYVLKTEGYKEVIMAADSSKTLLRSLKDGTGSYHGFEVQFLYQTKEPLQPKRYKAHLLGTTYVYDYPELFEQALSLAWTKCGAQIPQDALKCQEFVIDPQSKQLVEISRPEGSNDIGMVLWMFTMKTPEYPAGRQVLVLANDITHQIGSFGVDEDMLFNLGTEMAQRLGIPRIYLSANSGARIGLAEELSGLFQVAWKNEDDVHSGVDYLYLDENSYKSLCAKVSSVSNSGGGGDDGNKIAAHFEEININGQVRFKILDVIGLQEGIGVENLKGSGMIAGSTSRAYKDIFTISMVSCRSVGIGAYLVRLGQRVIQVDGHPIILTGSGALNKVLGREVYTSNLQLGGTQIMHNNGVTHLTAHDDMHGVMQILNWLSFVPKHRDAPLSQSSVSHNIDAVVDRNVEYYPTKSGQYDVRSLISGADVDGIFMHGMFDKGSFVETLAGWAKTTVVGRARLGGIPCGVIAVEVRSREYVVPADPACANSVEGVHQQAGQVWFPNNAFKTAQAINDFNHGEQLPLFILANWRGFSGGMMDMYNEILKYGAMIVDALSDYKRPVFVYLPPFAELRGGAWVVLDSAINPKFIEMYADPDARGGVLEPEGIVEIKFRKQKLLNMMERLNPQYKKLSDEYKIAKADRGVSNCELREMELQLKEVEQQLLPAYQQAAVHFADLHDKPERMLAKKAINGIVEWKDSRRFFYNRLKQRLEELGKF